MPMHFNIIFLRTPVNMFNSTIFVSHHKKKRVILKKKWFLMSLSLLQHKELNSVAVKAQRHYHLGDVLAIELHPVWDAKWTTPRHIIIKMPMVENKERILKAARIKQLVTYRGVSIRLSADFSKETLQAIRDWQGIFKVMKKRHLQP